MSTLSGMSLPNALGDSLFLGIAFVVIVAIAWVHALALKLISGTGFAARLGRITLEVTAFVLLAIDCVWLLVHALHLSHFWS